MDDAEYDALETRYLDLTARSRMLHGRLAGWVRPVTVPPAVDGETPWATVEEAIRVDEELPAVSNAYWAEYRRRTS